MRLTRHFTAALASLALVAAFAVPALAQVVNTYQQPTPVNLLDNGAFNVSQRGTATVSSITTTAKYLQDRWAVYAGTATSSSIGNTTSVPATFLNGVQVQRTSGQTGVLPVCLVQEIPTSTVDAIAGQPVAFSAWLKAGGNFSAANSLVTIKVSTGTGTDEGLATLISGWTGAASTSTTQAITTSWARYGWTTTIPASATEAAVQICFTPVGTAGTADYFQATGIQLNRGTNVLPFEARPQNWELQRAQRFFYQITESASVVGVRATCAMSTTSIANCFIPFPQTMRAAPTMTYTTGFQASATTASTSATACTNVTTTATLTGNAASQTGVLIDCASSAGFGAAGTAGFLWDVGTGGAAGVIAASADF